MQKLISVLLIFSLLLSSSNQLILVNKNLSLTKRIIPGDEIIVKIKNDIETNSQQKRIKITSISKSVITGIKQYRDGRFDLDLNGNVLLQNEHLYYKYIDLEYDDIYAISVLKNHKRSNTIIRNSLRGLGTGLLITIGGIVYMGPPPKDSDILVLAVLLYGGFIFSGLLGLSSGLITSVTYDDRGDFDKYVIKPGQWEIVIE